MKDWPCTVFGDIHTVVKRITEHSGHVTDGYLFIARKGGKTDGFLYIEEAIRRGASGIVIDRNDSIAACRGYGVPVIVVPDCRKFIAYASARLAGNPSERMLVVAVTGTNGKTTVTHFIGQMLYYCGVKAAVIGTTGVFVEGKKWPLDHSGMTTLLPEHFHFLLKQLEQEGVTHVVLEASSIGLSMNRLDHCDIDIGVFLNIGIDHYEEHGGRQNYLNAKKLLAGKAKVLIANSEDASCVEIVSDALVPVHYFNRDTAAGNLIDEKSFKLRVPGIHNKLNAVAAVSVLALLGFRIEGIVPLCSRLSLPEGRLQQIKRDGITVYIDYAHTPDALLAVLSALAKECEGKLITVFGCGGERDQGKRPQMGEIAARYSAEVIVTTDNPRSEDPEQIISEIIQGMYPIDPIVEPDRKSAIYKAVQHASKGDIILIAGKGHEKTQQTKEGLFPFSDYEVAKRAIELKCEASLKEASLE